MTQKQITLELDPTTETTGNAEQVAQLIGAAAWRISGDYLVVENPVLKYYVSEGTLDRIPNGAIVTLLKYETTVEESLEQKLKEQSIAPRVTLDRINELKARVKYVTVQQPGETTSTFVHAYLDGKFLLASGFSACVSADNFNADIGKEIAQKNAEQLAINKLWELEGYALYAKTNGIDLEQPAIDVNDYILSKDTHQNDVANIFECALTIKDNIKESTIVVGTGETASDAVQSAYKIAAALLSAWVY